jgi:uncharacterized protein YkwD
MRLRPAALGAALAMALAAASAPAQAATCANEAVSAAAVSSGTAGAAVRCLVNAQRARHGLPALRPSAPLRSAATAFGREMVARGFFDHVSPGGATPADRVHRAGYGGRTVGEAIGWGTGSLGTPAAIVDAWMNSPPHRAIVLSRRVRDIGVGVAAGTPSDRSAAGGVYVLDVGR